MQSGEGARRRARARIACKPCNSRRVRCNAVERRPCDNCRARSTVCEIIESRRGKRPLDGKPSTQSHAPASRTGTVESSTSRSKTSSDIERSATQDVQCDTSNRQTAHASTGSQSLAYVDTPSTVFIGESSSLRDSGPSEGVVRLCFSLPPAEGGETSTLSLARAGQNAQRIEYLRNFGAFSFPSDVACSDILLAYFTWFHPCFPIIDRPLFASAFANRTVSPLLLQSMLFVGATYCHNNLLQNMGFADRLDARSSFYSHAKDIYDADHEQDKFVLIQALFLLSYWRAGPKIEKNTRHWLTAAINLAQVQGIHRTRSTAPNQAELRMRKRIWWTLYVRDRQCSTAVGLPWFIHDQDCDVHDLDIYDFEENAIANYPSFLRLQTSDEIQYPMQMAKLVKIMRHIISVEFDPVNKQGLCVERAKVKEKLLKWEYELPPGMKSYRGVGSRSNIFTNSLHAYYNNLFILLYRSAFIADEDGRGREEGQVALQAAQSITSIAEDLISQDLVRYANTHLITCFFNSLCIHTISLRRSKGIAQEVAESRAHICLMGLKELRKTWEVDNWVLRLFFRHIEKPIARKLQWEKNGGSPAHQRSPSPGVDALSVETSANTQDPSVQMETANAVSLTSYMDWPPPDLFDLDWNGVSQFFNSKEAEDFSLFQLGSSPFSNKEL